MGLETKENEKIRYFLQISGVMLSHHYMVSPQNSVTRGGPPPSDTTASAPLSTPMALAVIVEVRLTFRYDTVP